MFEKLGGFKIHGGFFGTPKNLMPFKRDFKTKDDKIILNKDGTPALTSVIHYSIIYGQNGSGKSSITRALYGYANESDSVEKIQLLGNDEKEIDFSTVKKQIFVFNENFIKDCINFSESANLEAVVSFGKQKELDEQIAEIKKEIIKLEEKIIPEQREKAGQVEKEAEATRDKIANHLRKNWADRDRDIQKLTKDARHATAVSQSKLDTFFQNTIEENETTEYLLKQYLEQLGALEKLKGSASIEAKVPKIKLNQDVDKQIKALLIHSVEKPIFTEREQKIQALIEADPDEHKINAAYKFFSENEGESCPFCLQEVSYSYKQELLNAIRNVLDSEQAKVHRTEIDAFIKTALQKIEIDLQPFEAHFQDDVNSIKLKISTYNELVALAIKNLEQKAGNIYHPIEEIETDLLFQQKKSMSHWSKLIQNARV